MRIAGDRNALWFFIIAVLSTFAIAGQNYNFAHAAATLTSRLRRLSFAAILRQDSKPFSLIVMTLCSCCAQSSFLTVRKIVFVT